MLKSYYEILNVTSKSTKAEIKNQFRKLVRMYHPDVNSSIEAEQIFKEINKAAQVLLDDEKRKNYDALRNINQEIYKNFDNNKRSCGYTFDDLFSKRKQKNKKQKQEQEQEQEQEQKNRPINGDDITVAVDIDYFEAVTGTNRIVNISSSVICPKCSGRKFANGLKCPFCRGLGEKLVNKKITVKIPAKIKNNAKLRIKNEGNEGKFGGRNGNLYVVVHIEENKDFEIKNNIVYYNAEISPYMAILGGNIKVPTLWGEATIKIPPLTKSNQSFKLIDVGILDEKTNKKGEQIVKIIIQIPSSVSADEIAIYEQLRDINKIKNARI